MRQLDKRIGIEDYNNVQRNEDVRGWVWPCGSTSIRKCGRIRTTRTPFRLSIYYAESHLATMRADFCCFDAALPCCGCTSSALYSELLRRGELRLDEMQQSSLFRRFITLVLHSRILMCSRSWYERVQSMQGQYITCQKVLHALLKSRLFDCAQLHLGSATSSIFIAFLRPSLQRLVNGIELLWTIWVVKMLRAVSPTA
jgi:hypothetical protein